MADDQSIRILMIGPLPPPLGGISVSQAQLVQEMGQMPGVDVEVVDVSAIRNTQGSTLTGLLALIRAIFTKARRSDVVTAYVATPGLPVLGLLLLLLNLVLRKPLVLRKAANLDYRKLGPIRGRIAHFVVKRCSVYLAETKHLVAVALRSGISHVQWYPTSRPMPPLESASRRDRTCRRFVFVGQVRAYKGILELVEAGERFDETVAVDIYGPILDDIDDALFEGRHRTRYCGTLDPADVVPTLREYDAMVLPTKAKTEGYPGAIFESYAAGLPVITTPAGAIPEIVTEDTGVFVPPGDSEALYNAMRQLVDDQDTFQRLLDGVSAYRAEYDSRHWADYYVQLCRDLCNNQRG